MVTAKYERAGKPVLPKWWTDKIWPLLDNENYRQLADRASTAAGRESAWGGDAITKFRQGSAVTRELANAISQVLGVAQPFWEARSEKEALEFEMIRTRATQHIDDKLTPASELKRKRVAGALDDLVNQAKDQTGSVGLKDERSPRGSGPRRASGRRKATAGSRS